MRSGVATACKLSLLAQKPFVLKATEKALFAMGEYFELHCSNPYGILDLDTTDSLAESTVIPIFFYA